MNRPQVGVGVFIKKDGKFLLGKRKNSHGAGEWSLPGGHLEGGESFEACCQREVMEETGMTIKNIVPLIFTNDLFPKEDKHYVTLFFASDYDSGNLENKEPDKCEGWQWFKINEFPQPRFGPLDQAIAWIKTHLGVIQ
jgi:8-oxo-dGTP diphosphatase